MYFYTVLSLKWFSENLFFIDSLKIITSEQLRILNNVLAWPRRKPICRNTQLHGNVNFIAVPSKTRHVFGIGMSALIYGK